MDALSDVLRVANLSGGVFLHARFTAPWCIVAQMTPEICAPFLGPTTHLIPYHYVVEGELEVALRGETAQQLRAGDLILFPANEVHLMGSDISLSAVTASDVITPPERGGLYAIEHGGGGADVRLICGFLGCDVTQGNPVVSNLPAIMTLSVDETGPAEWIRSTFQYAADQIAAGRAGAETILAKLSELLFVEAVSRYVAALPEGQTGWLAALRDPAISRVLAFMHGDIARNWTVDELGREAGLSRSALAERFTRVIGASPMHYLGQWRMQVAAQKLKGTNASLGHVAQLVGYDSEAAFSRAFKKTFGSPPTMWRRAVTD